MLLFPHRWFPPRHNAGRLVLISHVCAQRLPRSFLTFGVARNAAFMPASCWCLHSREEPIEFFAEVFELGSVAFEGHELIHKSSPAFGESCFVITALPPWMTVSRIRPNSFFASVAKSRRVHVSSPRRCRGTGRRGVRMISVSPLIAILAILAITVKTGLFSNGAPAARSLPGLRYAKVGLFLKRSFANAA